MSDAESRVEFRTPERVAAHYSQFAEDLQQRRESFIEAIRSAKRTERQTVADTFNWSPNHERIEAALNGDLSETLRPVYLATYLAYTQEPDSSYAQQALDVIPASSPLWSLSPTLVSQAVRSTGRPEAYRSFVYDVLRSHPSDDVKPYILMNLLAKAASEGNEDRQRLLYAWLAGEYPDAGITRMARARYAPNRRIQAGRSVPSFEVSALRGDQTFTPEHFEDQYVLLDFWATWCAPCIAEFPTLRKANKRYGGDDFSILSIALDAKKSTVTTFMKDHDLPWKHAFARGAFDSDVAEQFDVSAIPKPVLVGPDGTIVTTEGLRGESLLETLDEKVGASDTP